MISMQVAMTLVSSTDTKTATFWCDRISDQICSALSNGSAVGKSKEFKEPEEVGTLGKSGMGHLAALS